MLELYEREVSYKLWLLAQLPLDINARSNVESLWMMQCPACGRVSFKEELFNERFAGQFNDHTMPFVRGNNWSGVDERLCIECGLRESATKMINEMTVYQLKHPSTQSYGMILFTVRSIDELLTMRYLKGKTMFELDEFLDIELERFWFVTGIMKPGCETMLRLLADEHEGKGNFNGLVTLDLTMVRLVQ